MADERTRTGRQVAGSGLRSQPVSPPAFATGDRLANRYRVVRVLGRGGMGEVYEVWDEELAVPVALKMLRLELSDAEEALRRLKREVLLARSISHPHVCRVYDLGHHMNGQAAWFLTMDLLRGETLQERLDRGRLPREEILPLVEQMASGLGAAHRAGVVHRDFKSGNVMLVGSPKRAVVTDFGLARAMSLPLGAGITTGAGFGPGHEAVAESSEFPEIVGTPAYMAPEQVRGDEVGPAADIYALGIVIYEMVTGRLPFSGRTPVDVARRRLVELPPPPHTVVPDLDPHWEEVILRCLAREPKARFAFAEDVADALSGRAPAADALLGARIRHVLPAERDAFVGRASELNELRAKLVDGSSRLVTLVGAAGMGKTRTAAHFGRQTLDVWSGGVWFCDLSQARSAGEIASAVASELSVPLRRGDPILQLTHAIAGRGRCLLILDNFEQAIDCAEEAVGRWLERTAEARFLVTSRERLKLRGEDAIVLESLPPEPGVELLLERARRLRPGLELEGAEAESARTVVELVDGMPLAIELAAERMRVLNASQLVARMGERFRLLAGAGGARAGRHATLEAAIDASWALLAAGERSAFAQCSVFEDGFTLEAAEAVIDLRPWPDAPWIVDVIQSLVDKSLLRMWTPALVPGGRVPEVRFGMYASLQEYARGRLRAGGGAVTARAVEERHGAWYARFGDKDALVALDRQSGAGRRSLELELANLTAACRRAVSRGDGAIATDTYRAVWEVLRFRGPIADAVGLGREVLTMPLDQGERASVLGLIGRALWRTGHVDEACRELEAALAIHRETDNWRGEVYVLGNLGNVYQERGDMNEARPRFDEALRIAREKGGRAEEGKLLSNLGNVHLEQARLEEARAHYEAALAIDRELGDQAGEGLALDNLGIVHYELGRMEEARAHHEAAVEMLRRAGNRLDEGLALSNLGNVLRVLGRTDEARACFEAALAAHRDVGDRRGEGIVIGHLGNLYFEADRFDEARAHYDAAIAINREVGDRRDEGIFVSNLGHVAMKLGRLEEAVGHFRAAIALHRAAGLRRNLGEFQQGLAEVYVELGRWDEALDAIGEAEALAREREDRQSLSGLLCLRAELELRRGDRAAARRRLDEASALAKEVEVEPDSELGRALVRLSAAIDAGASRQ